MLFALPDTSLRLITRESSGNRGLESAAQCHYVYSLNSTRRNPKPDKTTTSSSIEAGLLSLASPTAIVSNQHTVSRNSPIILPTVNSGWYILSLARNLNLRATYWTIPATALGLKTPLRHLNTRWVISSSRRSQPPTSFIRHCLQSHTLSGNDE